MKLVKVTHYRNSEDDPSEFLIKEGTQAEVEPIAKRWCFYTLPIFEGLKKIANGCEGNKVWVTFAEGLSKDAYWVRLELIS